MADLCARAGKPLFRVVLHVGDCAVFRLCGLACLLKSGADSFRKKTTTNLSLAIWLGPQCCFRQVLVSRYFYYGVAEPVDHFLRPPEGEAGTIQAARNAMTYSFLHWGIHGWVLYALLGVTLGYFALDKIYHSHYARHSIQFLESEFMVW